MYIYILYFFDVKFLCGLLYVKKILIIIYFILCIYNVHYTLQIVYIDVGIGSR